MKYKQGLCSGLLGKVNGRFVSFQTPRNLEERFDLASKVVGLNGLEIGYPHDFEDMKKLKDLINKYNFEIAAVNLKVRGPEFMMKGSFSSPEKKGYETAVQWGKEAFDAAVEVGTKTVTTCPLNDGFDYPFEMDYLDSWNRMVEGIKTVASHRDDVNLAIEYKLSDPRTRSLIGNVGEALTLANQTGRKNVGVNLDLGHCLIARENPAQAVAMATRENRLFHVHLNDNDRISDIDLMTGMVHFWETLEFIYYLIKLDYQGWLVSDVVPKENDPIVAFSKTIETHERYVKLANDIKRLELDELIKNRDFMSVMSKLQQLISL